VSWAPRKRPARLIPVSNHVQGVGHDRIEVPAGERKALAMSATMNLAIEPNLARARPMASPDRPIAVTE
jgi:hypothetical protein